MEECLLKLKKELYEVAKKEDMELRRLCGQGIMAVPELAFTYLFAKRLSRRATNIFNAPLIKWQMNANIGSGLTDLVIRLGRDKRAIAMEIKVGNKGDSYIDDLKKLSKLNGSSYHRVFCSLMDSWADDVGNHSRMVKVDNNRKVKVERIGSDFDSFPIQSNTQAQRCIIGIWKVL